MAKTLNLTGFQIGDNLSISVSQGALTAGPVDITAWAQTGGGGDGGPISIVVQRSNQQMAPDPVRLTVDLSSATFDTQGPGAGEYYDARLHDLIFLWDLGDSVSTYDKPVNMPTAWRDRSSAKGPAVGHVYSVPRPASGGAGTGYTVSVLVIEPSTGKTATAETEIFVEDPDTIYADADTIYINPVGDSDFSEVPAGVPAANKINRDTFTDQDSVFTATAFSTNPKRWRFKRGGTFAVQLQLQGSATPGVLFDGYGSDPARPVINWDGNIYGDVAKNCPFNLSAYGINQTGPQDIRWAGLDLQGPYDPTIQRSDYDPFNTAQPPIYSSGASVHGVVSDCIVNGWQFSSITMTPLATSDESNWHIDDCQITSFGGQYPLFGLVSSNDDSWCSITGCRITQPSGAVGSAPDNSGGSRAIARLSPRKMHMRCIDSYSTDQYAHHFQLFKDPTAQGGIINVHSLVMEGAGGGINIHGNHTQGFAASNSIVINSIIDGVFYLGSHSSTDTIYTAASGLTARNCHCLMPSINRGFTNMKAMVTVNQYGTFAAEVAEAPVRCYNSTFIYLRTDAQNVFGVVPDPLVVVSNVETDSFDTILDQNNILHKPNAGPTATQVTTYAPFTTTDLFTLRDEGYRNTDPYLSQMRWPLGIDTDWNDGETRNFSYTGDVYAFASVSVDQSNFSGSNGKEQVIAGSASNAGSYHTAAEGAISVTYGASQISVTNNSGVNWTSGTVVKVQLDMGSTAPIATGTAPSAGAWDDYKPSTGSSALGAATTGNVARDEIGDLFSQTAVSPRDVGAWQNDL